MNGILNILKPPGMTSQNVVSFVKRTLKVDKAGHTGTLDPGASGVLPVCIGKATRVSQYLIDDKKSYRAEMCIGYRSDTLDRYGTIEKVDDVRYSSDTIYKAFKSFMGKISQIPPMYSAVRHNGERLYDLARKGIVVDREQRDAYIFTINILCIQGNRVLFDVTCSKGTYIRTLCSDIGKFLGSDAIMSFLLRMGTGPYTVSDAVTLDELKNISENGEVDRVLYPIESALAGYSRIYVDNSLSSKIRNGCGFKLNKSMKYEEREFNKEILIFDSENIFTAIARINGDYVDIDRVFL